MLHELDVIRRVISALLGLTDVACDVPIVVLLTLVAGSPPAARTAARRATRTTTRTTRRIKNARKSRNRRVQLDCFSRPHFGCDLASARTLVLDHPVPRFSKGERLCLLTDPMAASRSRFALFQSTPRSEGKERAATLRTSQVDVCCVISQLCT
jgi:hypothetical protein